MRVGGSYYVALPKEWVAENVGDGGYVVVKLEEDGSLRLSPLRGEKRESVKSTRLTCEGDLYRNIVSAYLRGFEVIEITFDESCREEVFRVVEKAGQLLVGLEVVGEDSGVVTLQCFTRPDYDLESVLERMNSVVLAMLRLATRALETGDVSASEKVVSMDDLVDRLYFLAVRIIRSRVADPAYPSSEKVRLVDLRLVARNLESLGDLYEKLALSGAKARLSGRLYESLVYLQRAAVALALGKGFSKGDVMQVYREIEELLRREPLPPQVAEILDSVVRLLRDTLDLA